MNSKYLKYLPIFIIFILGGISITWTNSHSLLNTGDFLFPTNMFNQLYMILHSWRMTSLGSMDSFLLGHILPFGLYLTIVQLLGVSAIYAQMFWNYLLLTSMGLSMYFLVIILIRDETKYLAGFIAASFFMFNPWVALNVAMFFPYTTFIPLLLALYIKGLDENKGIKYLILFSLIWYFVVSLSLWNIRGYFFQWVLLICYLLFFLINNHKKFRRAFVFTFILIFFHILLNSHWLLLALMNVFQSASQSVANYEAVNYSRFSSFETASSTLMQALRLLADWSQIANIKGVLHFPWLDYYQNPLLIFVGFALPISVFVSLLYVMKRKSSQNTHFIFFFILLLFGYFVSMGKYNPLGMWMTDKFKYYLLIFSAPAVHGGIFIVISYSVLLAYSFVFVCRLIKNSRLRLLIGILYILAIMIYGYPVWSGQFIPSGNKVLGAGRYRLPSYVLDLVKKISQEKLNYRVFPLPYSILGYYAYNWEPAGFNGPDPLINILNKSEVIGTGLGRQIADTTMKNIDKTSFFRLNSLLNVKYIMNKRDANLLHINNNSWYIVPSRNFLNSLYEAPYDSTVGISSPRASSEAKSLRSPIGAKGDQNNADVSTFGQIDLIKVPDELFLPKLYTPLKVINAGNINELPNIVSRNDYVTRSAIYFGNHPNIPNLPNTPNTPKNLEKTILEYRMISPVKYRVRVHNAAGAFPLVMSESFHDGWKVYLASPDNFKFPAFAKASAGEANIQGTIQNDDLPSGPINETWFRKPIIEDSNHLTVNGYANSWIIDTNSICNNNIKCVRNPDGTYDFELVIEFWPQRLYYLGLTISLTTLIGCLTFLSWTLIKNKSKRFH